MPPPSLFVDRPLARRLERAEGGVSSMFVEARARLDPHSRAAWCEIGDAFVLFDGPESPITQAFGLGMGGTVSVSDIVAIESFFAERGAATHHELCPLAGVEAYAALAERGYRPFELSSVLVQALNEGRNGPPDPSIRVRVAGAHDESAWVDAAVAGWAEDNVDMREMMRQLSRVSFQNASMTSYLVEMDGAVVATGSMAIHEGVALLAGASTIPSARNRGAQRALLAARLEEAARRGCDMAMMATVPGSTSQRNAERNGFRVAYSRTKWKSSPRTVA